MSGGSLVVTLMVTIMVVLRRKVCRVMTAVGYRTVCTHHTARHSLIIPAINDRQLYAVDKRDASENYILLL